MYCCVRLLALHLGADVDLRLPEPVPERPAAEICWDCKSADCLERCIYFNKSQSAQAPGAGKELDP